MKVSTNRKRSGRPLSSLTGLVWSRLRQINPSNRALHTRPVTEQRRARSIFIRQVDCGSCNAAELEISALFNPVYDLERYGFHLVASPRHADILLLTGPFTRSMADAALAALEAMSEPRWVVTAGDGFKPDSAFNGSYAIMPVPPKLAAAWVAHIPGDPPTPGQIMQVLLDLELVSL